MRTVAVNLQDVQAFESLPIGKYYGEIVKLVEKPPSAAGKFAQLQCTYLVIDGDFINRQQSEWLSFSPKALFRMKRWFNKFGLGDIPDLGFDEDTDELIDPDLVGLKVVFAVTQDRRDPDRLNTDLVEVEEEVEEAAPPPPPPAPVRVARRPAPAAAPEPEPEADEVEVEAEEVEEAPAAPVRPRRPASPVRAAAQPVAARRTLR